MQIKHLYIYFLLLLSLCGSVTILGQSREISGNSQSANRAPEIETNVVDTVRLRYFTLRERDKIIPFVDTLFDDFEKYQRNRQFESGALNLGNFGSAHQLIRYHSPQNIYADAGFHQYDNYKLSPEDLKYFILDQPLNDLYFSPLAGEVNFLVKAKFVRNFAGNTQISLDYERILQEGFYNHQKTKNTRFVVGLWKQSPKGVHEYFFSFAANNNNEEINGGVSPDEKFDNQHSRVRNTIGIQLDDDSTRHQNFSFNLDNFFNLKEGRYRLHHKIKIESGYYRYGDHDVSTTSDSLVYLDYLSDSRGVRYFLGFNGVKNDFDLSFNSKSIGFKLGFSHYFQSFDDQKKEQNFHDLVLRSQLDFKIKKITDFRGLAEIGIGKNAGNLNIVGSINIRLVKSILVNGDIQVIRYDPSIIHKSVYVTEKEIFNNADFGKINEFKIGGNMIFEKIGISVGFLSGIIDQAIHYDNQALPIQKTGSTEYIQLEFKQKLKWKFIGIENVLLYQKFSENIYRLPKVYSIHNAYIEMRLFKRNLLTQVGLMFYNIRLDGALKFMPVTGTFYPTDEAVEYFPYSEFYANFKINQFRLFIKIDNFTDMINRKEHFQIAGYPQFDHKTRIGVRWIIRG